LSWQGKSKKGLELDSLKPSSTSIRPCVCQKRLRSCLNCLAWVPPLSRRLCHFSRNCFNTNREYLDYMRKNWPKFIMSKYWNYVLHPLA
jgi:hypothetical protein